MTAPHDSLAVVLGAGGVRGIAHIGVLQALAERGVRPDALVGVSAGALVASCYAALGWDSRRLEASAGRAGRASRRAVGGRRRWPSPRGAGRARGGGGGGGLGEIGALLDELSRADFESLHHGVTHLGVLCMDGATRMERLFVTGRPEGRPELVHAVVGSMTLPYLFPCRPVMVNGTRMSLLDGGLLRAVPIER